MRHTAGLSILGRMHESRASGRGKIRSHRDLQVWQLGLVMAKRIFALTRGFPEEERFGLAVQLRRAAVSVPSNVAEGFARGSARDYARFLSISRGSLGEIETQLLIARDLPRIDVAELDAILELVASEGRMLTRLASAVRTTDRRPTEPGQRRPAQGPGPRAQGPS